MPVGELTKNASNSHFSNWLCMAMRMILVRGGDGGGGVPAAVRKVHPAPEIERLRVRPAPRRGSAAACFGRSPRAAMASPRYPSAVLPP